MKIDDFRKLIEAETPGPWFNISDGCGTSNIATNDYKEHDHESGYWIACGLNDEAGYKSLAPEQNSNMRLIAALRNRASAFADLWHAARECQREMGGPGDYAVWKKLTEALKALEAIE